MTSLRVNVSRLKPVYCLVSQEITRLFSKKNCIDVTIGEVRKKEQKKKEKDGGAAAGSDATPSFEQLFARFQTLSYFDQHTVTNQCSGETRNKQPSS